MKRNRFTENQIVSILKEAESGISVPELCRKYGVGQSTLYKWRSKYGGMEVSDIKRLKDLEDENRKLKEMYANLSLKHQMLEDLVQKKALTAAKRREWVNYLREHYGVSISMACVVVGNSRSVYRYQPQPRDDHPLIEALLSLVDRHPRWGLPKLYKRIRALGHGWNKKRVARVYKQLKLNIRRKGKRRLPNRHPQPLMVPATSNVCWSIDCMSDVLYSGTRFRTFNVVDDFNRQALAIEVHISLTAKRIIRVLDRIAAWKGYPDRIRMDNAPEFTSITLLEWSKQHAVELDFIQPGCPYQNSYIERFNRTYGEYILDLYIFDTLQQVRDLTDEWIEMYNNERPHDSLNDMTPIGYLLVA